MVKLTKSNHLALLDEMMQDFASMIEHVENDFVDDMPWDIFDADNWDCFYTIFCHLYDYIESQGDTNEA